ncbi:hypothetical protein LOAG_10163 [Loa loa]|uniref:Uncharacterized protein n=1 Tax=Loa loa TaxID=7209 RepID=A0A1S0TQG0_LOALO|nr:hypothetical protein LOAG_10163 [Loa loa]EFO18334.1 hypothetical protein LOAG_10163 [Loa loa]
MFIDVEKGKFGISEWYRSPGYFLIFFSIFHEKEIFDEQVNQTVDVNKTDKEPSEKKEQIEEIFKKAKDDEMQISVPVQMTESQESVVPTSVVTFTIVMFLFAVIVTVVGYFFSWVSPGLPRLIIKIHLSICLRLRLSVNPFFIVQTHVISFSLLSSSH